MRARWRFDGDTPVHLTAIERAGFRLLSWGGACSGAQRACDTTVVSGGTAVTATFGPAVRVAAQTRGSGEIVLLDETPCVGECQLDLIPGAQAVIGAEPGPGARFVGLARSLQWLATNVHGRGEPGRGAPDRHRGVPRRDEKGVAAWCGCRVDQVGGLACSKVRS